MHYLYVFSFVELVSQRLDPLGVQGARRESEVRQLHMPRAIHEEVLNEKQRVMVDVIGGHKCE